MAKVYYGLRSILPLVLGLLCTYTPAHAAIAETTPGYVQAKQVTIAAQQLVSKQPALTTPTELVGQPLQPSAYKVTAVTSLHSEPHKFSLTTLLGPKKTAIAPAVPPAYLQTGRSCYVQTSKANSRFGLGHSNTIATKHYGKIKSVNLTSSSIISSIDNRPSSLPMLLDVRAIDAALARYNSLLFNYPIAVMTGYAKYQAEEALTKVIVQLTPYAKNSMASIHILYRVALAHHYARNLDMGQTHQLLELDYINRAMQLNPSNADLNYLYGTMIADSGGLVEAIPYFNTAISQGLVLGYVAKANTYKLLGLPLAQVQGCLYEYYLQVPYDSTTLDFQRRLEANAEYLWRGDGQPTAAQPSDLK